MKRYLIAPLLAGSLVLSGCAEMEQRPGETIGALVGAGVGLLLGSKVGNGTGKSLAIGLGALAGAWAGSQLGKALDEADLAKAEEVAQGTLEDNATGETSGWNNPDSGNSGTITPTSDYKNNDGEDCRDFESTVTVDGKTEAAQGRACRQNDGSWLIVQ